MNYCDPDAGIIDMASVETISTFYSCDYVNKNGSRAGLLLFSATLNTYLLTYMHLVLVCRFTLLILQAK